MSVIPKTILSTKLELRPSPIAGKGLFALAPIYKNEIIITWPNIFVCKEEALHEERKGKLIMQWDTTLYSVEERGDDIGYFINHSCDGNLWMNNINTLSAKRDISIGEEICADYVLWEGDENYVSKWECVCGTSECRKKITGRDWIRTNLQAIYKDHFSPLLNNRIATQFIKN